MSKGEDSGGERNAADGNARRLFVGVRISPGAVDDIVQIVESMQPVARSAGVAPRWLSPATYHITLKFLGWTRSESEASVTEAVRAAVSRIRAFEIQAKGLGAFPKPARASVLWAGIGRGGSELSELASAVERATTELGFPADDRPYHPHITFARLTKAADVSSLLLPFQEEPFRKSSIDRVVLFESRTAHKGAEYTARAEMPLLPSLR